ncbi:MAG TPA: DUF58 domain-containing protein [Thermoanaerobaculia bacterium]|nr:DUF58 domain-containing protein [Thermoanaerobaculia bacterium]
MSATKPWTFDGVVRLTKIGTTYVIFTIVIGIAALNTGNNALYIGVTFMLGCLLLSGIASKGGLKHLSVEVRGIEEVWAGRQSDAFLRIRNSSRIWNVRDVVMVSNELAEPVLVPIIPRRGEIDISVSFLFRKRGSVHLERIDSYTRYPFGFFLKKRRLRIDSDVVVYPRIREGEGLRERFRPITGEQSIANRPGPGSELHSFRDYVRGDSLRHVYWKKSASLGRWIMKQTDAEAARIVHIVVDPYKPRSASEDDFEEMISSAATFAHEAIHRGLDVVLSLPRVTVRVAQSQPGAPLFRALALVDASHEAIDQPVDRNSVIFTLGRGDVSQIA